MMRIEKQGCIFDVEKTRTEKKVCTFTSLFKHSSGRIFSSFRRASKKDSTDGEGVIAEFIDYSEWKIVFSGFQNEFDGKKGDIKIVELFERKDKGISAVISWFDCSKGSKLYDTSSDTLLPARLILTDSYDMGKTWSNYRVIDSCDLPGPALTGPVLKVSQGYLVFFETYGPEKPGGSSIHAARALFSKDGTIFDRIITVARHPEDAIYYWDQRSEYDVFSGRIVSMFWSYDRKKEKDIDIHIAYGDSERLRWTKPIPTGIKGQIAKPITVSEKRILCFYVHRHYPGSMRLIVSDDGGKVWKYDEELIVYQDSEKNDKERQVSYAEYWEDMNRWNFGHPAGILLDKSRILLAYYAGKDAGCLSARYAIISF